MYRTAIHSDFITIIQIFPTNFVKFKCVVTGYSNFCVCVIRYTFPYKSDACVHIFRFVFPVAIQIFQEFQSDFESDHTGRSLYILM